ncbi:LytTR family DNA-binding domain-containing protein [Aestuariivita boseongensis]|uniref:LytTR family DNA-binding domain-containing protein n=1 Tax=Aestuariivita boseongensis TaxID=1470562 RepID=UPI0006837F78|nr:LytTR family DNA-binding domain-containing protein [Aestuariivita boseongensis]
MVLVVAGPFGTYETVDWGWRFVYWGAVVSLSAILGYLSANVSQYLTQRRHPVVSDLVATLIMVVLFSPLNLMLTDRIVVRAAGSGPSLLEMMAYVAAITFAIMTGRRFVPGLEEQNYLPKDHDINKPRLLRRLPSAERARVLRISSQDHFVDVVTDRGSSRLRMRLADAIDEMDGVRGYCTHRSHWVAETAIAEVLRDNGKPQLRLENGDLVPISRKYKPDLEQAGLL